MSERERPPTPEPGEQPLRNVCLLFAALWRLVRGEDQRGRKVRWMIGLLRPYRGRMALMFVALLIETGAGLAPPYLAGRAIDAGIDTGDLGALDLIVAAFVAVALALRRRHLRRDLPGRLGRHARPAGPARAHLHPPPVDVDRLLHPAQPGRADLADDQRRRGAQPARHQRRRDDLLEHPDPGRRGRDPARARRQAGADHLPHLPAAADRQRRLPDRLRRRLPGDPGADRGRHRLPAGDAERRPGRAQLRPGAAPRRRDDRAQRGQPRGQHEDGLPQRLLLPGGRTAGRDRDRGDPALRRQPGDRRGDRDRRHRLLRRLPDDLLRTDPAALPALHDLPAGDGGARQDLRPARHRARHGRRARGDRPGRRSAARSSSTASGSPTPTRRTRSRSRRRLGAARRRPARAAGADPGAGRRDRRRQVDLRQAGRPLLRPAAGHACWSTATTCAACSSGRCGASSGSSPRRASSSPAACARTSPSAGPRRASRRSRRRSRRSARPSSSPPCRTGSRPRSASAASSSRPASASWSPSPAPCSPSRGS